MTSVYKRVDRITPGSTDQIEIDGVVHKDGKVDDQYVDIQRHPEPAFRGTEVDSLSKAYDRFWSAGVISGGDISYNGLTQELTVSSGQAILRSASTTTSSLESITFPAVTFSVGPAGDIDFDDPAFISLDYNSGPGGTPIPIITTSSSGINCQDNCLIYTIIIDSGSGQLFVLDAKAQNVDHNAKLRRRFFNTERLTRASNGSLVSSVPGTLHWQLSAGEFYFSLASITHPPFDTSPSGGDTFTYFYADGSSPTGFSQLPATPALELDNNQWNNGGTLTLLDPSNGTTGNAYNVSWLYVILSSTGTSQIAAILGEEEYYTVAEAQAATPPSNLPALIEAVGVLVGRAIVGGNFVSPPTEPTLVETTFARVFTPTSAAQHNNLGGLQGGAANTYQHSDQGINQADSPNWVHIRAQYSPTLPTAPGNAGNVGFGFAGDQDTGMFQNGADTLEFATDGTSRFRLLSDGDAVLTGPGELTLHRGITGERSTSPTNGMIRYNTTDNVLEFFVAGNWQQLGGASGVGDFVHRYGDTMTGNLNVTDGTNGSELRTDGGIEVTKDTAFVDLIPTGTGAKARMSLDTANQQMKFFVLNSASGTFTVPGLVIDNSLSTQDIRPGSNESARLGTASNKWADVVSAEFLANNGTASNPAFSFISAQDTGIFHDGGLNFTVDANNKISVDTNGIARFLDTTALRVNNGTVAERPSGENGMIRYNTDNNTIEFYINGSWLQLGSTGGTGDFVNRNGDTMLGALNMNNNFLLSPADPTNGSHVGDRNYNDLRYVNNTGDSMTGNLSLNGANFLTDTGLETAPTYTFNGDTDTGMYSPAADTVSLTTAGTDSVTVDTTGVTVYDNLDVQGIADLPQVDNFGLVNPLIRTNTSETGSGITTSTTHTTGGGSAFVGGLEIERGTDFNVRWVFDETNDWWGPGVNDPSTRIGNINFIDTTTTSNGEILDINGVGAIVVPNGQTSQRPGTAVGTTAQDGMIRYNDSDNALEARINGSWLQFGGASGTGDFVNRAGDTMTGDLVIDTTGALTIPNGTTAQRPGIPDQGMVRYNTSQSTFEGYDGSNWRGLGGVIDVDQDTYILAETSAGADNDQLQFFAQGNQTLEIDNVNSTFTSNIVMSGHLIDLSNNILRNPSDPTSGNHVGDRDYNDARYVNVTGDTITGNLTMSTASIISEDIRPDTNNTRDIGTSSLQYNTVYANTFEGTATSALYADLAERYEADSYYESGTVLVIGGDKEVTAATSKADRKVIGVVSTNPAHLMNAGAGDDTTHPPIALAGRIPVKVYGYIEKGDMLVTGEKPGTAVATHNPVPGTVIGKALENYKSDVVGFIEMVVRPS